MSLFIRLSTLASIAVLLRCVPATVVITAPSTVIDNTAGLETRQQGPTAWICSALAVDSPWTSYANIRGYLEGGNAEKKDYSNFVLFPVMELSHARESRLCVYLPAEDHCYPPAPSTSQVKAVKQLSKRNYYAIRFWGQASDARVQYYKQKLTAALNTQSKAANFDLFFVSHFSDHVREVRYDLASTVKKKGAEPLAEVTVKRPLTCPSALSYSNSSTTTKVAGQEYLRTTLLESRLSLSDVRTRPMAVRSLDACAMASPIDGNAFSFVMSACKVYDFKEHFCPCAPGDFDIYINPKQLGNRKEFTLKKLPEGVKEMVIYTDIPLNQLAQSSSSVSSPSQISLCAAHVGVSKILTGAFIVNNQCFTSRLHDFANCNRTCRGQPADVFVRAVDPFPPLPILALCGQKIVVPVISNTSFSREYVSHAGFGCYRYQGTNTAGGEDCIVTFEKDPNAKMLKMDVLGLTLDSVQSTCRDVLSIYNSSTTAETSRVSSGCSGQPTIEAQAAITIKFHRRLGSGQNFGFKLDITNILN